MKLTGLLTAALVMAAPALASAQGHGGGTGGGAGHGGVTQVAMVHGGGHGGFHGPGNGINGRFAHDHFFHDRFHDDRGLFWGWGYPYWGWSDCDAYGDSCGWGGESGPGAPSDDYGYTEGPPANAACGTWIRHGGGYAWTRSVCGDPPAADPPAHATAAANECSDWVWRASEHRSVCKRAAPAVG